MSIKVKELLYEVVENEIKIFEYLKEENHRNNTYMVDDIVKALYPFVFSGSNKVNQHIIIGLSVDRFIRNLFIKYMSSLLILRKYWKIKYKSIYVIGTPDIVLDDTDTIYIIDIKTSSGIYPQYILQLILYGYLILTEYNDQEFEIKLILLYINKQNGIKEYEIQLTKEDIFIYGSYILDCFLGLAKFDFKNIKFKIKEVL